MKKITKVAALLAASALLMSGMFFSCSDSDDSEPESTPTEQDSENKGADSEAEKEPASEEDKGGSEKQNPTDDDTTGAKATAKTYDFAVWTTEDLAKFGGDGQYSDSKGNAKNTLKSPADTTELSTGASIYNKSANAIMIRTKSTTDLTPTSLNYNGGIAKSIADGVAIEDLDRYVKIHVDGEGTVSASVKIVNSSSNSGTLQIAFVDGNGKLLGAVVKADVATGNIEDSTAEKNKNIGTVEGTVSEVGDVYLAFSRNGASGGGLDVYSIEVQPAN